MESKFNIDFEIHEEITIDVIELMKIFKEGYNKYNGYTIEEAIYYYFGKREKYYYNLFLLTQYETINKIKEELCRYLAISYIEEP